MVSARPRRVVRGDLLQEAAHALPAIVMLRGLSRPCCCTYAKDLPMLPVLVWLCAADASAERGSSRAAIWRARISRHGFCSLPFAPATRRTRRVVHSSSTHHVRGQNVAAPPRFWWVWLAHTLLLPYWHATEPRWDTRQLTRAHICKLSRHKLQRGIPSPSAASAFKTAQTVLAKKRRADGDPPAASSARDRYDEANAQSPGAAEAYAAATRSSGTEAGRSARPAPRDPTAGTPKTADSSDDGPRNRTSRGSSTRCGKLGNCRTTTSRTPHTWASSRR